LGLVPKAFSTLRNLKRQDNSFLTVSRAPLSSGVAVVNDKLTIDGLTTLDRYELEDLLGREVVSFDEHSVSHDNLGELGTIIAVVLASKVTLAAFAVWSSRRYGKKKKGFVFRQQFKITRKNGTMEERLVEFEADSETSLQEGLATRLADIFNLDPAEILAVVRENT
jgi:hypothetical protein